MVGYSIDRVLVVLLNIMGILLLTTPFLTPYRRKFPVIGIYYQELYEFKDSVKAAKDKLFKEGHVTNQDEGFDNLSDLIKNRLDDYGRPQRINRRKHKGVVQVIYQDTRNSDELTDEYIKTIINDYINDREGSINRNIRLFGLALIIMGILVEVYL